MDMKELEISLKMLVGEDVSDEEKAYFKAYELKYAIVRQLVMEKLAEDKKKKLMNFHFTPGENFMTTPTIDVINTIIETFSSLENATPMNFGDSSIKKTSDINAPVV